MTARSYEANCQSTALTRLRESNVGRMSQVFALLGPRWALFRATYAARRKLGFLERAMPVSPWPTEIGCGPKYRLPLDPDYLRDWLVGNYSDQQRKELADRVANLQAGKFEVFGQWVKPQSWHHDPITPYRYHADAHWSKVALGFNIDIKRVWEPSRFSWSFDLARHHLLAPEGGAANTFWSLLDDWMEQNPPNQGVNWWCGQEAAIRLMACAIAAEMMSDTCTPERHHRLQQLAYVTGHRIEANISYARSQANNHHLSEAVGLVVAASFFPRTSESDRWLDFGLKHATEVSENLVFRDGGSSQYSINYHRVFLHNYCALDLALRGLGQELPDPISHAFEKATDFMSSVVNPYSGYAPAIGQDDGANLLPIAATPHRYMRSHLDLCRSFLGKSSVCETVADQEPGAWLGKSRAFVPGTQTMPPTVEHFADFGLVVMTLGRWRVYLRCGNLTFRPSQDDQLHCDVWLGGENLAFDAGTHTYHPLPRQYGDLGEAKFHNTMRDPKSDTNMIRLSKFLWGRSPVTEISISSDSASVTCEAFAVWPSGRTDRRTVTLEPESVIVVDVSSEPIVTSWNVAQQASFSIDPAPRRAGGITAPQYGSLSHGLSLEAIGTNSVTSRFSLPKVDPSREANSCFK